MRPVTLDAATLEKLISAAVAASAVHDTRSWRYRLDPDTATLEVHAAAERGPRQEDPYGRALHVSVGAALFNLRVAVAHFGWQPIVRTLPDLAEEDLLGTVRLAWPLTDAPVADSDAFDGLRERDADDRADRDDRDVVELYDAMWRRPSSRSSFSRGPVSERLLARMTAAAAAEGAEARTTGREEAARLLRLTAEAGARAESLERFGSFESFRRPVSEPRMAVLSTSGDERVDWLRSGQALQRMLLIATRERVGASPLYQALEWPDLRRELLDGRDAGHVQMLLQLGGSPQGPVTTVGAAHDALEDLASAGRERQSAASYG